MGLKPATLPPLTTRTPTPRMVLPSANAPAETATWPNGVGVVKDYACPYAAIRDLARARADPLFGRIMPVLFRPFRFLRLPRPVVKDYACPFPGLWELRGLREVAVAHSAVVEGLGLSFARPRGGSCRIRGVLHARILRLPRPVVKDYACPFLLSFSVSFCSSLAKPYLVRLFHSLPSSGLRRRTLSFSGLSPGPSSQLPRTSNLPFAREIR